jgi:hypothetical protein
MLNLFKHKKTDNELIQEQYLNNLENITEHYNGVRINQTLLGRIRSAKMDETTESKILTIKTHSSVPRPKDFGTDLFAWLDEIKKEAKEVMNKLNRYKKEEEEYQERIKQEMNKKAIEKQHKFFVEYGVLNK